MKGTGPTRLVITPKQLGPFCFFGGHFLGTDRSLLNIDKRNWKEDNLELDRQERAVPLLQCSVQREAQRRTADSAGQRSEQVENAQSGQRT